MSSSLAGYKSQSYCLLCSTKIWSSCWIFQALLLYQSLQTDCNTALMNAVDKHILKTDLKFKTYTYTYEPHRQKFSVSESTALARDKLPYIRKSMKTNYWQNIQQVWWTYYLLIYAVTVENKNHAHMQQSDLDWHLGNRGYLNCAKSWYVDMGTYSESFSSAQFISDIN